VRIESVRHDASGDATIVASGGIIFLLPRQRIDECAALVADRLGSSFDPERLNAGKSLLDSLSAADIDFEPEDSLIQDLKRIDEAWKAEKKGLELCARAEQSSQGLIAKLGSRGFSTGAAAEAVQRLIEAGAVDDTRFATIWARARAERRLEGPALISAGLRSRGLGQEAIRKALDAVDFDTLIPRAVEKESRRLSRRFNGKGDPEGRALREALYRSLKGQGFDSSLVREELGY